MNKKIPVISVIMPVYNGERFLIPALNSILDQTFEDFELIIINDGSTDRSLDIIKAYLLKDRRLRVLENKTNLGLISSLNIGLSHAFGRIIARMDQDDISHPLRFEKQVKFLDTHPEIGLLGTSYRSIDETGKCLAIHDTPREDVLIRWVSLFNCAFCHPSVMFRREIYKHMGGYDPNMENAEDFAYWSRLLKYTKAANLPDWLVDHRISDTQISTARKAQQIQKANVISKDNINYLMGQEGIFTIEEVADLRSWYIPTDQSTIPPDPARMVNSLIAIYRQFSKKNLDSRGVSRYVVFLILNIIRKVSLPIQIKINLFIQSVKINPLQSLKTIISLFVSRLRFRG